jgi:hypothetical protein
MSVTLCVLLWARDGKAEALATYEDRVLDLLDDHDARVAFRGRASGEGDTPTEVQILIFASGEAFDAYMQDERRLAMSGQREAAIARTQVIPVEPAPRSP